MTEIDKQKIKKKSQTSKNESYDKNREKIADKFVLQESSPEFLFEQQKPRPAEKTSLNDLTSESFVDLTEPGPGSSDTAVTINEKNSHSSQDKVLIAFEKFANSLPQIEEFYCEMK